MSTTVTRIVNFGKGKSGLATAGYQLFDATGSLTGSRITTGITELVTGSGIYSAEIVFPDDFNGSVFWDTGDAAASGSALLGFAAEEYNFSENADLMLEIKDTVDIISGTLIAVSGCIDFIKDIEGGRWRIVNNQMIFFKEDNSTEVARFDLFDSAGFPTETSIFERRRV